MEADAQPLPRDQQSQRKRRKKACEECRRKKMKCNDDHWGSHCVEVGVDRTPAQTTARRMVLETDEANRSPVSYPSKCLASVASTAIWHQPFACNSSSGFGVESRFPIKQHAVSYGLQPPPPAVVYDRATTAAALETRFDPTTAFNILLNITMPKPPEPSINWHFPIVSRKWYWSLHADISELTGVTVLEATLPSYCESLNISRSLFESHTVLSLLLDGEHFLETVKRSYSNWSLPKAEQIMLHLVVAIMKHVDGLRDASLGHLQHSLMLLPDVDISPTLAPAPPQMVKSENEPDDTRLEQGTLGRTLSREAPRLYDQAWCKLQKLQVLGLLSVLLLRYRNPHTQDVAAYGIDVAAEQNGGQCPDSWLIERGTWEKDMMETSNQISRFLIRTYRAVAYHKSKSTQAMHSERTETSNPLKEVRAAAFGSLATREKSGLLYCFRN